MRSAQEKTKDTWVVIAMVSLSAVAVLLLLTPAGYQRYKLPSGDIVECLEMVETPQGNFHLTGCRDRTEYIVQGTIEVLSE